MLLLVKGQSGHGWYQLYRAGGGVHLGFEDQQSHQVFLVKGEHTEAPGDVSFSVGFQLKGRLLDLKYKEERECWEEDVDSSLFENATYKNAGSI